MFFGREPEDQVLVHVVPLFTDPDGKLIVFQTYEDAVKKCQEMNSKLVDRNLRYFVERQLASDMGRTEWKEFP